MDEATSPHIPALARALPQMVLTADGEGTVHFANGRWTERTGLPPEAATGDGWLEAVHPDDRARVRDAWAWARAGDRDHVLDARLATAGGGHAPVRLRTVPDADAAAGAPRWYLLVEPVGGLSGDGATSDGSAEAEAAPRPPAVSVFIQDADLRYRWVHNPYPTLAPGRILGRTDAEIFGAESAAALTALKRRALETAAPARGEVEVSIGGVLVRYQLYAEPRVEGGEAVGLFVVATDVTERDEAEVRASETHLRDVLSSLFAFVGVLDTDGTVRFANRAPLEAAGLSFGDVRGRKFWDAPWWSYDAAVQARLRDACAEAAAGGFVRYDVEVQMADGLMPIDFQIAPLRDAAGAVTHLIPSAVDITVRVEAERARHEEAERFCRGRAVPLHFGPG